MLRAVAGLAGADWQCRSDTHQDLEAFSWRARRDCWRRAAVYFTPHVLGQKSRL